MDTILMFKCVKNSRHIGENYKKKRTLIYTIALTYNFDSAVLALQADEKSQYIH